MRNQLKLYQVNIFDRISLELVGFYSTQYHIDLLETNLTIWMLKHPVWDALENDPRKNVQNMYKSSNTERFTVDQQKMVLESGQAHVSTVEIYELKIKKEVEQGLPPSHKRLDDSIIWLTYGNHLRLNDVLTDSVLTYLGRMQDSGIIKKILSKYYMSNGKLASLKSIAIQISFNVLSLLHQLKWCITLQESRRNQDTRF